MYYNVQNQKIENAPRFSCEYSHECGGCEYTDISYRRQLNDKYARVSTLLSPLVKVEPIVGMDNPYHYRNKVHAVFAEDKKGLYSGIYKHGTHKVIRVRNCLIEDVRASKIIQNATDLARSFRMQAYNEDSGDGFLRHITLRIAPATGEIMVTFVTSREMFQSKGNFVKELLKIHPEITTITQNVNSKNTSMVFGDKDIILHGRGYIEDILSGCRFRISPRSFYQVNSEMAEKLFSSAKHLADLTKNDDVLDAYCGIGTIGLIMQSSCRSVTGIELNQSAVLDAKINAKINSALNCSFYKGDAGEFMVKNAAAGRRFGCVFMDPPRTGSSAQFIYSLKRSSPRRIVYISCNPETLARDLVHLEKIGYRAKVAIPFDMFPFTPHVECAVLLTRK